jgi:hypothetical protein
VEEQQKLHDEVIEGIKRLDDRSEDSGAGVQVEKHNSDHSESERTKDENPQKWLKSSVGPVDKSSKKKVKRVLEDEVTFPQTRRKGMKPRSNWVAPTMVEVPVSEDESEVSKLDAEAKSKLRILEQLERTTPDRIKVCWDDIRARDGRGLTTKERVLRKLSEWQRDYSDQFHRDSIEQSLNEEPNEYEHSEQERYYFDVIR